MKLTITLRYVRDPELVAIRFNSAYSFQGLAKQTLRAYVEKRNFEIRMPYPGEYEKKSLTCNFELDEKKDADVIRFLKTLKVPKTTFVRNLMLRAITGNTEYVYLDEELKKMALPESSEELRATAQKISPMRDNPINDSDNTNVLYQEELSKALENLKNM